MEVMSYVVMMFMEELNGKNNINIFINIINYNIYANNNKIDI